MVTIVFTSSHLQLNKEFHWKTFWNFIEKQIDLKTVNLKKLKVRDLKKILSDWEETCDDCIEKGDFIKRIESLKPKYVKEEL